MVHVYESNGIKETKDFFFDAFGFECVSFFCIPSFFSRSFFFRFFFFSWFDFSLCLEISWLRFEVRVIYLYGIHFSLCYASWSNRLDSIVLVWDAFVSKYCIYLFRWIFLSVVFVDSFLFPLIPKRIARVWLRHWKYSNWFWIFKWKRYSDWTECMV